MYLDGDLSTAPAVQRIPLLKWWAGVTADLWRRAAGARSLRPASTKPSDDQGLFDAGSSDAATGMVQAFSGKGDEWYTVSTVAADPPGFGTITTAAHSSAATDVPHLLVQAVPMGPQLLLYIALQPRVDVVIDHEYLRQYYKDAPPPSQAPAQPDPRNGAADGASNGAGAGAGPEGILSWQQLQQRAYKQIPGWAHYRSRGLEMNVMGSGLDIFGMVPNTEESLAAVADVCRQAMDIWLAFSEAAEGDSAGEEGPAAEARRRRDAGLRQLLLEDPDLGMAERLFGHDGMQTLLKIVGRHPDVLLA